MIESSQFANTTHFSQEEKVLIHPAIVVSSADHLQCIKRLQKSGEAAAEEGDGLKESLQKKAKLQKEDSKGAPVKRITDFFTAR